MFSRPERPDHSPVDRRGFFSYSAAGLAASSAALSLSRYA
jgi:hypothetical protein